RMNDALGARAFTVGSDVFVRRSEYRPGTSEGDALLGHELAHTVQQGAAGPEVARSPRTTLVQRDPIPADEWEEHTLAEGTIVYHATPLKFAGKLFQGPIRSAQDEYDGARTNPVYPDVNGWLAETYPEVLGLWPSYESALGYGFYTHLYRDEAVVGMSTVKTEGDSGWGVLFEYEVKENLTVRRLPEKGYEYHSLGNPDDYIQAADVIGGPHLGSVGTGKKRIVYATHAEMKFHNPQDHLKFLGVRWFLNPTGNAPDMEFGTTRYGHPKDLVKAIQEGRDMMK
ncbi:MAG: DUF4157 domain-containing protein, partial [Actinomycetota bacterium]|nr:DUF4157 domain-containing protein [Actinomycetota bacterium]